MVTRVSPDHNDFSIVLEKMTTKDSQCARGANPLVVSEDIVLQLKGGLLAAARKAGGLRVWHVQASAPCSPPCPCELSLPVQPR